MKSLVFIAILLVGSLSANFLQHNWSKSKPDTARHLLTATPECIDAIKGGKLAAGGITLSHMPAPGGGGE